MQSKLFALYNVILIICGAFIVAYDLYIWSRNGEAYLVDFLLAAMIGAVIVLTGCLNWRGRVNRIVRVGLNAVSLLSLCLIAFITFIAVIAINEGP